MFWGVHQLLTRAMLDGFHDAIPQCHDTMLEWHANHDWWISKPIDIDFRSWSKSMIWSWLCRSSADVGSSSSSILGFKTNARASAMRWRCRKCIGITLRQLMGKPTSLIIWWMIFVWLSWSAGWCILRPSRIRSNTVMQLRCCMGLEIPFGYWIADVECACLLVDATGALGCVLLPGREWV